MSTTEQPSVPKQKEQQSPPPPSHTSKLEIQCMEDSTRWFPGTSQSPAFMALSLCGEVGEVANIIKKIERGSLDPRDAKVRFALVSELADVYTYLLCLAGILKIDLEHAYNYKRLENEQRFGKKGLIVRDR